MGQYARLLPAVTVPDAAPDSTAPVVEVDLGRAVVLYYEGPPPEGTTFDQAVNAIVHALREELGPAATSFRLLHAKMRRTDAAASSGGGIGTVGPDVVEGGA